MFIWLLSIRKQLICYSSKGVLRSLCLIRAKQERLYFWLPFFFSHSSLFCFHTLCLCGGFGWVLGLFGGCFYCCFVCFGLVVFFVSRFFCLFGEGVGILVGYFRGFSSS